MTEDFFMSSDRQQKQKKNLAAIWFAKTYSVNHEHGRTVSETSPHADKPSAHDDRQTASPLNLTDTAGQDQKTDSITDAGREDHRRSASTPSARQSTSLPEGERGPSSSPKKTDKPSSHASHASQEQTAEPSAITQSENHDDGKATKKITSSTVNEEALSINDMETVSPAEKDASEDTAERSAAEAESGQTEPAILSPAEDHAKDAEEPATETVAGKPETPSEENIQKPSSGQRKNTSPEDGQDANAARMTSQEDSSAHPSQTGYHLPAGTVQASHDEDRKDSRQSALKTSSRQGQKALQRRLKDSPSPEEDASSTHEADAQQNSTDTAKSADRAIPFGKLSEIGLPDEEVVLDVRTLDADKPISFEKLSAVMPRRSRRRKKYPEPVKADVTEEGPSEAETETVKEDAAAAEHQADDRAVVKEEAVSTEAKAEAPSEKTVQEEVLAAEHEAENAGPSEAEEASPEEENEADADKEDEEVTETEGAAPPFFSELLCQTMNEARKSFRKAFNLQSESEGKETLFDKAPIPRDGEIYISIYRARSLLIRRASESDPDNETLNAHATGTSTEVLKLTAAGVGPLRTLTQLLKEKDNSSKTKDTLDVEVIIPHSFAGTLRLTLPDNANCFVETGTASRIFIISNNGPASIFFPDSITPAKKITASISAGNDSSLRLHGGNGTLSLAPSGSKIELHHPAWTSIQIDDPKHSAEGIYDVPDSTISFEKPQKHQSRKLALKPSTVSIFTSGKDIPNITKNTDRVTVKKS